MTMRTLLALLAVVFAGCKPNLSLPPDARIACAADGRCPAGYACRTNVGRCFASDAPAPAAPDAKSPALTPAVAAAGTVVRLSFTATAPLFREPRVELETGKGTARFVFESRQADTWTFAFTPAGDESPGQHPVVASLVDADGGEAQVALGSVAFDFTPPKVTASSVSATAVRPGTSFQVHVALSEPATEATLSSAQGLAATGAPSPDGAAFDFSVAVPEGTPEAPIDLALELKDAAGNVGKDALRGPDIDATAPSAVPSEGGGLAAVELVPEATNILRADLNRQVTLARPGTHVSVRLAMSEPPSPAPTLTAVHDSSSFSFGAPRVAGPVYAFDVAVPAGLEDGKYDLVLAAQDAVGNALPAPGQVVGSVALKSTSPDPPETWSNDVVLERAPWGTLTSKTPHFTLLGAPHAAHAGLYFIAWEDAAKSFELGRATAAPAGAADAGKFQIDLPRSDRINLYLTAVDGAGNVSDPSTITRERWITTMNRKKPGSALDNPNTFEERRVFDGALVTADRRELGDADGLGAADNLSATTTGGGLWRNRSAGYLPGRHSLSAAYDPLRARVVVFGGTDITSVSFGDTWERGAGAFVRVPTTDPENDGDPPGTTCSAMAWDSNTRRLKLLVSKTFLVPWSSDGKSWRDDSPSQSTVFLPGQRSGFAAAWDTAREMWIVFGGKSGTGTANDNYADGTWLGGTWMLRKGTLGWGQWNPYPFDPAQLPPPRAYHAMAYDPVRGKVVMAGGMVMKGGTTFTLLDDVWEWNGSTWKNVTPTSKGPLGRAMHAMTWDSRRQRVVLVGGCADAADTELVKGNPCYAPKNDVWEWDGTAWASVAATDTEGDGEPGGRAKFALADDAGRGGLVAVGGVRSYSTYPGVVNFLFHPDSWLFTGSSWRSVPNVGAGPAARDNALVAFDSARGRLVQFGGTLGDKTDTWELGAGGWQSTGPTLAQYAAPPYTGTPSGRVYHALAYDPNNKRVVLFGGMDYYETSKGTTPGVETWLYDGANPSPAARWTKATTTTQPSQPTFNAMAWDPVRKRIVLVGGGKTWLWDGAAWTDATASVTGADGHPGLNYPGLTFDGANNRLVLAGIDGGAFRQTWTLDSTTWKKADPAGQPDFSRGYVNAAGYAYQPLSFDPARGAVAALFPATVATGTIALYAALGWSTVDALGVGGVTPEVRGGHGSAYVPFLGGPTMFGGISASGRRFDELWTFDWGAAEKPAQVFTMNFEAASLPALGWVDRVTLTWKAGATANGTDGAVLRYWSGDHWVDADPAAGGSNTAASSAPGALKAVLGGADTSALTTTPTLTFAITPRAPNGPQPATIATEAVEAVVDMYVP